MEKRKHMRTQVFILALLAWLNGAAFAHAPLFMLAPEAPGKGAFDLHTSITHSRQGDGRRLELEQEFTYGITRDFALGFAVPLAREENTPRGGRQTATTGIDNPEFFGQWRFWDKDVLGAKYSSALRLSGTAPIGDKKIARNKPSFTAGLAYGMESLKWYHLIDARYLHNVEDSGSKPGDRFFADVAVGLRPHLGGLEETDIVFFLELNYLKELTARANGTNDPNSGGDFLFVSPEVLISPSNRLMIRGGIQIPIYQELKGIQEPKDFVFKIVIERRY